MSAQKLILIVGLPRSGKSTKARQLMHVTPGAAIVNADSIRLAMGHRFHEAIEPMVHAIALTMADALFRSGHTTVIVDECNVTKDRRSDWINRYEDIVDLHIVPTGPKECIRRAQNGTDDVLVPVIKRMAKAYDLPRPWSADEEAG